jgi:hypothetical protein
LGILLSVSLALRIWHIDLAQVGYDEAAAASLVAAWKFQGHFPLTGIVSSVGVPNPPAWPYLLSLGLLASNDPYALVTVGVAFGFLAVVLCWWVGRRWLGPWGGLAATAFYGTAFWPVLLGRGAWQPVFLQAPILLCLDALLMLAVARRPWALVVVCGWLALLVQLHYILAASALLLPLAMWPARRTLRPVHVFSAALAGLLPLLPFLLYELHPGVRFRDVGALLGLSSGAAQVDLSTLRLLADVTSTGGAAGLGSPNATGLREALGRWTTLTMLGPLLVAGGIASAALWWPRGWLGWLLAAWTLLPVVLLARHPAGLTSGMWFHYLWLDFPGFALAVGALAASAAASRYFTLRAGVASALVVYIAISVASLGTLLTYVDRADTHSGYGVPLRYSRAAGHTARALVGPGGQVLIGDEPRKAEILRFMLGYDAPSSTFEDCREVPYVAQGVYLLMSEHTPGAAALAETGAPLLARIERPGDTYRVYGPMPSKTDLKALDQRPEHNSPVCRERQG